jgi:hypothetical protein
VQLLPGDLGANSLAVLCAPHPFAAARLDPHPFAAARLDPHPFAAARLDSVCSYAVFSLATFVAPACVSKFGVKRALLSSFSL